MDPEQEEPPAAAPPEEPTPPPSKPSEPTTGTPKSEPPPEPPPMPGSLSTTPPSLPPPVEDLRRSPYSFDVNEVLPPDEPPAGRDPDEPDPDCPLCFGRGFLRRNLPVSDRDFGKAVPCGCYAAALHKLRLARLYGRAQLPPGKFSAATFATYRALPKADLEGAAFVESWAADGGNTSLFLWGETGRGKTGLAISGLRERIASRGDAVLYRYVPDLYDDLKRAFDPARGGMSSGEVFDLVRDTPLVLFDDLGKENPTAWVKETFSRLIDYRWRSGLPTMFTSNDPPTVLHERFDAALESRVLDMCGTWVYEVETPHDLRPGVRR